MTGTQEVLGYVITYTSTKEHLEQWQVEKTLSLRLRRLDYETKKICKNSHGNMEGGDQYSVGKSIPLISKG